MVVGGTVLYIGMGVVVVGVGVLRGKTPALYKCLYLFKKKKNITYGHDLNNFHSYDMIMT